MNIFEYRQTLNLIELVNTGTIGCNILRNQELYSKYDALRKSGLIKTRAIEQVRTQKYFRALTPRTVYMIIRELETEIK
jgi:hypothetical protein